MKRLLFLAIALTVIGCASPTATPEPTATAEPTATIKPSATPEPTRRPTATLPAVPADPDAFAEYIIDSYGDFEGEPIGVTGEYLWLDSLDNHLIVKVSKGFTGAPYDALDVTRDEGRVEDWVAPIVRDMESFAPGEPWAVWYSYDYTEKDAARAGRNSVDFDDWMRVDTEYDSDAGGFSATEYPIRISKPDLSGQSNVVRAQFFPFQRERMAGYYLDRLGQ